MHQKIVIELSRAAVSEIKRLQSKRHTPESYLRLGIQPGGCAQFYYTLDFDATLNAGDRVYDCSGIHVVVDAQHLPYLNGLRLDYSEDLMGGGFRFHNPNAAESCGCGNSFRLAT